MEENELECSYCSNKVSQDSDFCPECGTLLIENVKCTNHENIDAEGVCIICCEPYCKECGFYVDNRMFLCNKHSEYKIYEGMARVIGATDVVQLDYIKSCLEQAGFHPVILSQNVDTLHTNLSRNTHYHADGVMVPLQEVIEAERTLQQLGITT